MKTVMYLHLGLNTVITTKDIIGIFDMDTSTVSKNTREYLTRKEKEGKCKTVSFELPASFVLCEEKEGETVYITQLSTTALQNRANKKNTIKAK